MALLMERIDTDTIRLVGRWRSNAILGYLHTTLDTAQQDTPVHVQCQPSGAVWNTYDITAHPQTRISPHFSKETIGPQSEVQKSLQHSMLQPQSLDPRWGLHQTTPAHAQ